MTESHVLRERARALAQPVQRADETTYGAVAFMLRGARYAFRIETLREAFRLGAFVRLPGAPPHIYGVTAWRGDLLTLLDIRAPLQLATASLSDLRRVIVLGRERQRVGVLVDDLLGAVPLHALGQRGQGLVEAVAADGTVLLDAAAVLQLNTQGEA